jgi:hypothetical protein
MEQPKSKSLMIERLQSERHRLSRQGHSHASKKRWSQDIPKVLPFLLFSLGNPNTRLKL